jgi:hypothetical protein
MGLTCVRARQREEGVTGVLAAARGPLLGRVAVCIVVTTLPQEERRRRQEETPGRPPNAPNRRDGASRSRSDSPRNSTTCPNRNPTPIHGEARQIPITNDNNNQIPTQVTKGNGQQRETLRTRVSCSEGSGFESRCRLKGAGQRPFCCSMSVLRKFDPRFIPMIHFVSGVTTWLHGTPRIRGKPLH